MKGIAARWLTALVGIPLFLTVLIAGGPVFALFLALLVVLSARELSMLFSRAGVQGVGLWIGSGGLLILVMAYTSTRDGLPCLSWVSTLGIIVLAALIRELFTSEHRPLHRSGSICLGSLYLGLYSFLFLTRMEGIAVALVVVLGTWATDTLAFFVGRAMGHKALAPAISPKKTWAGAIAGLLGGMIAGVGIAYAAHWPIWHGAILGIGVGLASQLGDLVESAMKREAGVKDSGTLLPGHGGVLDRFDSLLFTGATVYYLRLLLM